jgi:hypothetical protein
MATRLAAGNFQSQLNLLSRLGVVGDLTDADLLGRCLSTRDGEDRAAFTALVERHGPTERCRFFSQESTAAESRHRENAWGQPEHASHRANAPRRDSGDVWRHGQVTTDNAPLTRCQLSVVSGHLLNAAASIVFATDN